MPASAPPERSVAAVTASRRPAGVDRSATTSVSSLSTPMTRQPAAASRPAVAAPMPDAAPVMTTARSGSGPCLQESEGLVGVRTHGDLGVEHIENGAVGVDHVRDPLVRQEADAALGPELGRDRAVRVGQQREAETLLLVALLLLPHAL